MYDSMRERRKSEMLRREYRALIKGHNSFAVNLLKNLIKVISFYRLVSKLTSDNGKKKQFYITKEHDDYIFHNENT